MMSEHEIASQDAILVCEGESQASLQFRFLAKGSAGPTLIVDPLHLCICVSTEVLFALTRGQYSLGHGKEVIRNRNSRPNSEVLIGMTTAQR
jgi:hypothetical protein